MTIASTRWLKLALLVAPLLAVTPAAWSQVVVEIDGNTAHASISLNGSGGSVYAAEVIIVFDSPLNLSAESLNLTAEIIDPADPIFSTRMPGGIAVDADFPVMVTVEPPVRAWLFASGFDNGDSAPGELSFLNSYEIEVHTSHLVYTPNSPYRLLKAPVGGPFADITQDVLSGSTRARGRSGAFSQFVVGADNRIPLLVVLGKVIALDARLLVAVLNDGLRLDLIGLLVDIQTALLLPLLGCSNALAPLDQFIATVQANAGTDIANLWRAQRDLVNDAGELESLANTLRFSLLTCASNP